MSLAHARTVVRLTFSRPATSAMVSSGVVVIGLSLSNNLGDCRQLSCGHFP
jgi:hypothetical protein